MKVVELIGGERDMQRQQEAKLLAEFRRMNEKERRRALAFFCRINKEKPELPVFKLVVGGK